MMASDEREGLGKIRRLRSWLWIFLIAYIPVVVMIKRTANSELALVPFVIIWVVGVVRFATRAAFSRCPRCGNLFHSASGSPTFFNLLAQNCMQCGLPLKSGRAI